MSRRITDAERRAAGALRLPWTSRRTTIATLIAGLIGVVILVISAVLDPARTAYSYLTAYVFASGIALNALILILIEALIAAEWFVAIRRVAEGVASALPALAVLFVPIALWAGRLYPWTDPSGRLSTHAQALVSQKAAYLNLPFFFVRAAVCLACWAALAEFVRRGSLEEDRLGGGRWVTRVRWIAGPGLILIAFTLTIAAFDWVMSLEPAWYSTIFGVDLFAGGMVGALGVLAIAMAAAAARPGLAAAITPDHASGVGKLLLTFVIFWAYASFSQLLIIWIGNLPDEVTWYVPRLRGGWLVLGSLVAVGEFALPFFALLSYARKRRLRSLAWIGLVVCLSHYLEIYWLVIPEWRPDSVRPFWSDLGAPLAVLGLSAAWIGWRWRDAPALAVGDPHLGASIHYIET